MKRKTKILVLGKTGMLGRVIYAYFKTQKDYTVLGTSRRPGADFRFEASTLGRDLKKIITRTKGVDFVINCIGLLRSLKSHKAQYVAINILLPLELDKMADVYNFKLIHISTDAVFADSSGAVDESSPPSPENVYGMTKYLGEPEGQNSISIRTSFLGFDPEEKKGLLEFVKNAKGPIPGYANQIFTGATTLQVAEFCKYLISNFDKIKRITSIFHFTPVGPITRLKLIEVIFPKKNFKIEFEGITKRKFSRKLKSKFHRQFRIKRYNSPLKLELERLLIFEKHL